MALGAALRDSSVVFAALMIMVMFCTWMERKVIADLQKQAAALATEATAANVSGDQIGTLRVVLGHLDRGTHRVALAPDRLGAPAQHPKERTWLAIRRACLGCWMPKRFAS